MKMKVLRKLYDAMRRLKPILTRLFLSLSWIRLSKAAAADASGASSTNYRRHFSDHELLRRCRRTTAGRRVLRRVADIIPKSSRLSRNLQRSRARPETGGPREISLSFFV